MAIQSGIWAAGINVADRALQLLNVIILARILSPEAFGLLGVALLVLGALQQFSNLGFDSALVQHESDNIDEYLNTLWLMKIARGAVIATITIASGPLLAQAFGEPEAAGIIQVIGFSPLLLGIQNPAIVYFQKDLHFHKEFIYKVGGRTIDILVAVATALVYQSVWALLAGLLAGRVVMVILSYAIHDYRPGIEFNREYAGEMFEFGKWMFASGILVFLYGQGDDVFIGWFFSASALGLYQLAYRFSNAPATEVTQVISRVAFPAFSKVQNDTAQLREGYFRVLHLTTIAGFPMAAGVIAIAPQFVLAVLGEQWEAAIPVMQALAFWGAIRSFGASTGALFKAVGRPEIGTKIQALKVAILVVVIYPAATEFGLLGVAGAVVVNAVLVQPLVIYMVIDVTEASLSRLLFLLMCPLTGSVIMGLAVIGLDRMVITGTGVLQLGALVIIGVVIYIGVMLGIENISRYEFSSLVSTFRGTI
ncbi:lipopolysaccharide biosynthesis protein [Haloferax sp. ATB1]|uniref:lipopolysaccharide biosynthesis protein n=1 Tax=Haloferax sp. ATB1 TaxID=1508454 RepID=UPI001F528C85|nr:lipopolysaccharide biosynthesis protein [Haloferax sp. ATB1]